MKVFAVLVVVAALAYSASADNSPCDDTCQGACGLVNQWGSLVLPPFAPLVQIFSQFCLQGCTVFCGCTDSCYNQCAQQITDCVGANTNNPIIQFFCSSTFPGCAGFCLTNCGISVFTGIVQQFAQATTAVAAPPAAPAGGDGSK